MPISSNFHFSPNLTGKLNFSTDTQFISLDQDKIIPAHKKLLFLTDNYPLTIYPNSISGQYPNSNFPDFYTSHLYFYNHHPKILLKKTYTKIQKIRNNFPVCTFFRKFLPFFRTIFTYYNRPLTT